MDNRPESVVCNSSPASALIPRLIIMTAPDHHQHHQLNLESPTKISCLVPQFTLCDVHEARRRSTPKKSSWKLQLTAMTAAVVIVALLGVLFLHCASRVDCLGRSTTTTTDYVDEDYVDDDPSFDLGQHDHLVSDTMSSTDEMPKPADADEIAGKNKTSRHHRLRPDMSADERRKALDEIEQAEWALLARENVMQMRSDSIRCATPRPRVIKVQDVHPHAFKRFVPSCLVLHRCDRESGCCDDVDNVCSAVQKQRVAAHFYVVSLGESNGVTSVEINGRVERLRFTNHTQCGCRRKRRRLPADLDDLGGDSKSSSPTNRAVTGGASTSIIVKTTGTWSPVFSTMYYIIISGAIVSSVLKVT